MDTRKKILIVDDEIVYREFFDVMLPKLGFSVENAADGEEALEKVKRFSPDLILLDNIMPKMSGWEVTKILKNDTKYQEIPIIMFSALDDVKDKVTGFEMGIDDYITKPFNFSEVLARIRAALRNRELLFQIMARESRLSLVEKFNADIKSDIQDFAKSIDALDEAIVRVSKSGEIDRSAFSSLLELISEKTGSVRKYIAELDARLEKTITEWETLKKDEIGLTVLARPVHTASTHGL